MRDGLGCDRGAVGERGDPARRRLGALGHPFFERDEQGAQRRGRAVRVARVDAGARPRIGAGPAAMLRSGDQVGAGICRQFGVVRAGQRVGVHSEAPFCQYSVAVLVSMTSGSVGSPLQDRAGLAGKRIGQPRAVLNGNQFSG